MQLDGEEAIAEVGRTKPTEKPAAPERDPNKALASQLPLCVRPHVGLLGRQRLRDSEDSGRIFLFQSQVIDTDFLGTG